jgi:hypothetical protein
MGMISSFGKWVDNKFPDRVVVTNSDYLAVVADLAATKKELAEQNTRLINICKELATLSKALDEIKTDQNKLKLGMGFKAMGLSPAAVSALQ